MDVNLKVLENPGYDDKSLRFDVDAGKFIDRNGNPVDRRGIDAIANEKRSRTSGIKGDGQGTGIRDAQRDTAVRPDGRTIAGSKSVARAAILRALLRESGGEGQGARGRDGILARLAKLASDRSQAVDGLFQSRF